MKTSWTISALKIQNLMMHLLVEKNYIFIDDLVTCVNYRTYKRSTNSNNFLGKIFQLYDFHAQSMTLLKYILRFTFSFWNILFLLTFDKIFVLNNINSKWHAVWSSISIQEKLDKVVKCSTFDIEIEKVFSKILGSCIKFCFEPSSGSKVWYKYTEITVRTF